MKKPVKDPQRHTGRDEVEIRYPVKFFSLDSGYPPPADSGMTDLVLTLKHSVFHHPASGTEVGFFLS